MFAFHGGNGSMQAMAEDRSDLVSLAERDGFILVFPNGQNETGNRGPSSWNAVWCCGDAHVTNKSDVEFVRQMVAALSGSFTIDPKRIHAMGFSNGGMLSYRLAAEIPDTLASAAVFGASAAGFDTVTHRPTKTAPTRTIPLLIMHGAADRTAPIEGGESEQFAGLFYLSQAESLEIYTTAYHCNPAPSNTTESGRKGRIVIGRYTGCDAELVTVLMEGVGHGWPDVQFAGFDGVAQAWEFLRQHPKP
jgi:polyhydroxybutyrate depolymerase